MKNPKIATPFAHLLSAGVPARLPKTAETTLVVDGQRITNARQLKPRGPDADALDLERAAALKAELERDRNRRRYQRDRQDPEKMAKRRAYYLANREKVREWKREYDLRNRDRTRPQQAAWARRQRIAEPEVANERVRRYYERNREKVLERSRQRRLAAKVAKGAQGLQVIPWRPQWTLARQAWLECVETDPLNKRQKGQVGFQCARFGWTRWQRAADGSRLFHEELTDDGRAVLAAWRRAAAEADLEQPAQPGTTERIE